MRTLETFLSALIPSLSESESQLQPHSVSNLNVNNALPSITDGVFASTVSPSSFSPPSLEAITGCLNQLLSEHVLLLAVFSPEDSPISPSQTQGAKVAQLMQAIRQGTQTPSGLIDLIHPICLFLPEMNAPIKADSTFEKAQEGIERNLDGTIPEALLPFMMWKTIVILPSSYQPAIPHLAPLTNTTPLFYYFDPTIHQPDVIPEAVAQLGLSLTQGCQWETTHEGKAVRVTVEPILSDLTFVNASQALCPNNIAESTLWAIYFAALAIGTGQPGFQSMTKIDNATNTSNTDSFSFTRLHEALQPFLDKAYFREMMKKSKETKKRTK